MPIKSLTKAFAVAPQVSESDIIEAQKSGFVTLIDARPDGEDEGQPTAMQMAAISRKYGLGFTHVPVTMGTITDADIAKFATALDEADGPVLGYCRTGTRAAMLWSLAQAGRMPAAAIFDAAAAAGIDISAIKPKILQLTQPT